MWKRIEINKWNENKNYGKELRRIFYYYGICVPFLCHWCLLDVLVLGVEYYYFLLIISWGFMFMYFNIEILYKYSQDQLIVILNVLSIMAADIIPNSVF